MVYMRTLKVTYGLNFAIKIYINIMYIVLYVTLYHHNYNSVTLGRAGAILRDVQK